MDIRRLAHGAAYLGITILLTGLGVTAWVINTLRDLGARGPRLPRPAGVMPKPQPKPESQLSSRGF
jgi:hypothetical protein